jgi:uncharacterized protein YbaA (DUF1428 family)
MSYVDGFVAAVPEENKQLYIEHTQRVAKVFIEYGATQYVECWEDDVPDGKMTSMKMAVKLAAGESVVFSWIVWPSKQVRDQIVSKVMQDPRIEQEKERMPFDASRLIFGGFETVVDESA